MVLSFGLELGMETLRFLVVEMSFSCFGKLCNFVLGEVVVGSSGRNLL